MFNIDKYLQKFTKNIQDSEIHKQQISEIIKQEIQVSIPVGDIEIKDYIIYIQASPAIKNKIFIYKAKILESLSSPLPIKVVDIK